MTTNWAAVAAICSLFTIAAVVIGWAFTHGQLTQVVRQTKEDVTELKVTTKRHGEKLEIHQEKIGRLEEWKDGFSHGYKTSAGKHEG